jgi:HSP20 family protein
MKPSARRTKCRIANGWKLGSENKPASSDYSLLPYNERSSLGEGRDESLTTSSFAPAVDVYEDEHKVTLKIEVPGIDEKDIDVRVENNTLTVHGERKIEKEEKEEKEENYRRVERQYGSFTRTFTLPTTLDTESVSATYDTGVLKVNLPKKAEAKPKQNKVTVGSEKSLEGKGPSKAA